MRGLIFLFFVFLLPFSLDAQRFKGSSLESNFHIGKLIKHSKSLSFDNEGWCKGFELNWTKKRTGDKDWEQRLGYPSTSLSIWYQQFIDKSSFGEAIGLLPAISFPLLQGEKSSLNLQGGWGLSYISQAYDPIDNRLNNAISTPLNFITLIKLDYSYPLASNWSFKTGFSFVHFSNGAYSLPNYGINISSLFMGLQFTPHRLEKKDFKKIEVTPLEKKWGMGLFYGRGNEESLGLGGLAYKVKNASIFVRYNFSKVHELQMGVDYEYKQFTYEFGRNTLEFETKEEARRKASVLGWYVADELYIGKVGLYIQLGLYVPPFNYRVKSFMYNKYALRYYLPPFGKPKTSFYFALTLKSHVTVADYFTLGIGAKL